MLEAIPARPRFQHLFIQVLTKHGLPDSSDQSLLLGSKPLNGDGDETGTDHQLRLCRVIATADLPEGRLKETEQGTDGEYRWDTHSESKTEDKGGPDDHRVREDFGYREFSDELVYQRFTNDDTYPQPARLALFDWEEDLDLHSTGQGVILTNGSDVGLPSLRIRNISPTWSAKILTMIAEVPRVPLSNDCVM